MLGDWINFVSLLAVIIYIYTYTLYFRYIESLSPESKYISDWEGSLCAKQENTTIPDNTKLPTHWFKTGTATTNVVEALWTLRNNLLRDSLNII